MGQFDQRSMIDYIIISKKRVAKDIKLTPGVSQDFDLMIIYQRLKLSIDIRQGLLQIHSLNRDSERDPKLQNGRDKR